jgi:formylglycine-generating enzyme required for sulfatase activity
MSTRYPETVKIEGGTFWMGSKSSPYTSERPYHQVRIESFYLGIFPITNEEFNLFLLSEQKSSFQLKDTVTLLPNNGEPVCKINWYQAVKYCQWLAILTGKPFRLPTEAEWEYAGKAGRDFTYPTEIGVISPDLANYRNHVGSLTPVGTYPPNPFGLYDMAGNVWEWCSSRKADYSDLICFRSYDYPYDANDGREDLQETDAPHGFDGVTVSRILRGGCYTSQALHCRSTTRYREFENRSYNYHPSRGENCFGFRVAMST